MVCSVTTLSPGFRYWPGLTSVMPSRPENGARMVFLSMVACWAAAWARLLFKSASSPSICAWEMAWAANCTRSRVSVVCARSAAASSEASCARSESAFNCTSTAPDLISSPDLKRISRTRPAISVVTSTPRSARRLPTAFSCGCHSCLPAVIDVTTTGGWGAEPCAICCMMLRNTTKPITATRRMTPTIMMSMRFFTEYLSIDLSVGRGCAGHSSWGWSGTGRGRVRELFVSIPPSAAERLKQSRGVCEALRARLDQRDRRGLIALFGGQHLHVAGAAALVLRLHQAQAVFCRLLGHGLRGERFGVGLQGVQRVRYVLKGGDDRGLVIGGGFLRTGDRGAALMPQLSALEQGLRQRADQVPHVRRRLEQVRKARGVLAVAAAEGDLRQHIGGGDSHLRRRLVQQGRVLADVRPLLDEFGRQADGQVLRYLQRVQGESRARVVRGQGAHEGGQLIALLGELTAQRRQAGERVLQRRLLLQHIGPRCAAGVQAALRDFELFLLR